jgi:multidrug resistance efflux pump
MLEKARWDLDQTVVRAPSDGYVPQVLLQPGQMATALGLQPLMVFIPSDRPTLIASFQQKAISGIKPGMHGEAIFEAYPGRSFKVKVRRVLTAVREGELDAKGNLLTPTAASAPGHIPVVFDYEEDIAGLDLPAGSQASIAIYTDRVHALSIVRKIILRMKSWENYLF